MKMNLYLNLITVVLMFISGISVDAKTKNEVWDNPEAYQNIETYFPGLRVNVNKVEFNPDETIVTLHIRTKSPDMTCMIPSSTVLQTEGKAYTLRRVEGHEIDVPFNSSVYTDSTRKYILH